MDLRAEIQQFLAVEIFACEPSTLPYDCDVGSRIDSWSAIQLLDFIEARFNVVAPIHMLSPQWLDTIDAIASTIESIKASKDT
jgi:acyl carrier protein